MPETVVTVAGPENAVEIFRKEILADLKEAGVPAAAVEVSTAKPAPLPITEPEPLGHIEWVQLAITLGQGVVATALNEVVKHIIQKRLNANKLKSKETETSG